MNIADFIVKHKFGILGTVFLHVFLFIYLASEVVEFGKYVPKEKVVAIMDFTNEVEIEDDNKVDDENATGEEINGQQQELSNVAANENQQENTYTDNYSFSKSQTDQEVWNELMELEANEYGKINAEKSSNSSSSTFGDENGDVNSENAQVNPNLVKDGAEKNTNASFGSTVKATASYSVKGRTMQLQGIPAYKCRTEGIVRINIKVNQKGEVISREIDESHTTTQNDCLRSEAIAYSRKWRFTQNFNDPMRIPGWIEFKYVAQ